MANNSGNPTQAIIFASYGTTRDDAKVASVDPVAKAVFQAFPGWVSMSAYTSQKVRLSLDARGEHTASVAEALHVLLALGVRSVVVQSGHVVAGRSYGEIDAALQKCGHLFDAVEVGLPLLSSSSDAFCLAEAVCEHFPKQDGSALVLVGHGGGSAADELYAQVEHAAHALGRPDVFVGTLHGAVGQAQVSEAIRSGSAGDVNLVRLAPLMLCAGAHAHSDMAGSGRESWESLFGADGFEVEPLQVGLGQLPAVRELFVQHAREAAKKLKA